MQRHHADIGENVNEVQVHLSLEVWGARRQTQAEHPQVEERLRHAGLEDVIAQSMWKNGCRTEF